MNWATALTQLNQIDTINKISANAENKGVLIYKHSTRCAVSLFAYNQLVKSWPFSSEELPVFMVDVLKSRTISNAIAMRYQVQHQSPQLLFIKNSECLGNASHHQVSIPTIQNWLNG